VANAALFLVVYARRLREVVRTRRTAHRPPRQPAPAPPDDRTAAVRRGRPAVAAVHDPRRGPRPDPAGDRLRDRGRPGPHPPDRSEYAIALLAIVLLVAQLQTAAAILTEEIGFGRYRRRDLLLLGGWGLLEMFWYQPLSALWRVWASFLWLIGRRPGWGTIPRGAALAEPPPAEAPELAPAPLSR